MARMKTAMKQLAFGSPALCWRFPPDRLLALLRRRPAMVGRAMPDDANGLQLWEHSNMRMAIHSEPRIQVPRAGAAPLTHGSPVAVFVLCLPSGPGRWYRRIQVAERQSGFVDHSSMRCSAPVGELCTRRTRLCTPKGAGQISRADNAGRTVRGMRKKPSYRRGTINTESWGLRPGAYGRPVVAASRRDGIATRHMNFHCGHRPVPSFLRPTGALSP